MNVRISPIISGSRDEEYAGLAQGIDRVRLGLRIAAATVTRIDSANVGALRVAGTRPKVTHLLDVVVGFDRIGSSSGAGRLRDKSEGHQTHLPVNPGDPQAVVAHGADRSGHMSRVRLGDYVAGVVAKVIAINVTTDSAYR